MTDFADAFKRGQDAAALAAQARAELEEVFAEAREQLLNATDGKLELSMRGFPKPRKRSPAEVLLGGAIAWAAALEERETEPWIAARNPKAEDTEWVRLAKWDRPQEGYPCQISYDRTDVRCHDRTAFADAIGEMLANAWIGEKLRELLNLPLKQAQ
ncbi:hypothetical protein AB4Y32_24060 [Paraburkholderia phymatum]|uniref:Uncharacterized protein n=1 Tax=Paraburkholderia phymatum TaxID=148447 RepID=A0ACC6U540_9BURK